MKEAPPELLSQEHNRDHVTPPPPTGLLAAPYRFASPSPAPNLRNSVAHVFIRTDCNKWMFMYSITLSGVSLLSPSMMGTQRCRPRLNNEDLSKALVGGALEHGSLRSYSRRGLCCSFALNYWYLFAWFFSDFQMRVHVQYFTFLSAEGRGRPLWMFGARWRPRSSLLCESLTSVKPTTGTVSGVGVLGLIKAQQHSESWASYCLILFRR